MYASKNLMKNSLGFSSLTFTFTEYSTGCVHKRNVEYYTKKKQQREFVLKTEYCNTKDYCNRQLLLPSPNEGEFARCFVHKTSLATASLCPHLVLFSREDLFILHT